MRRSGGTWTLLALLALLTVALAASATRSVLVASGTLTPALDASDRATLAKLGVLDSGGLRLSEAVSAAISGAVGLLCLVLLLGLLAWKPWAREGTMGLFGLTGALLLIFAVAGTTVTPRGSNARVGIVAALAVLAVAALCVSPPVRRDFELREVQRQLRAREAATAKRIASRRFTPPG